MRDRILCALLLSTLWGCDDPPDPPAEPACEPACEVGQTCVNFACLAAIDEACGLVACDNGLLCAEGLCVDSACADGDCPEGYECLNFTCSPVDLTGHSVYTIAVTTWLGDEIFWEANLTDKLEHFSFGSTHIGPAVALAVSHTMTSPSFRIATFDFGKVLGSAQFPLQCGETGEYPYGCDEGICGTNCIPDGPHDPDLQTEFLECLNCKCSPEAIVIGLPPGLELNVEGVQYLSSTPGSTGSMILTEWGNQTGQVMAGSFAGRLYQDPTKGGRGTCSTDLASPCYADADCGGGTCDGAKTLLHIDVEGDFYFTLPQKDSN